MAKNPTTSLLDPGQVILRCYDEANDAVRVEIPAVSMAIALDAATGDNVATVQSNSTQVVHLTQGSTGTATIVLAPISLTMFSKANIFLQSTTAIAAPPNVKLQISPDDSANAWVDSGLTVTASASNGITVMGTPSTNLVARRGRLVISAAIGAAETLDAYLILGT